MGQSALLQLGAGALLVFALFALLSQEQPPTSAIFRTSRRALSSSASRDSISVQTAVTTCRPITDQEKFDLQREIINYEKNWRFEHKMAEARGERPLDPHHAGVLKYLKDNVLRPNWSVLELGCAAGSVIRAVRDHYHSTAVDTGGAPSPSQDFVGVELVTGWAREMKDYLEGQGIDIFEGENF